MKTGRGDAKTRRLFIPHVLATTLFLAAMAIAAEPNKWVGGAEDAPRDWSEPANWSTRRAPEAEDGRDVIIPAECAHYPLAEGRVPLAASLIVKEGAGLELEPGTKLILYAGHLDTVEGPSLATGRKQPRGLVVESGGRLLAGGESGIVVRAGGVTLSGELAGHPRLHMEGVFHSLPIHAPGLVFQRISLGASRYPYPVLLRGNVRILGDLVLEGGELRVAEKALLSVGGDVLFPGNGPAALTPDGPVEVSGTIKSEGGSVYRRAADGWVSLVGKGPRRIAPGGVLPPIKLNVDGTVTLASSLHSAGLLVGKDSTLQLQKSQGLTFGVPRPEWIKDPQSPIVIQAARPRIPRRGSKDLTVQGQITGVEWVPLRLYAQDGPEIYRVTADFAPGGGDGRVGASGEMGGATAGNRISINHPNSRLQLKDGKLTLDGKPAEMGQKPQEDLALEAALEDGVNEASAGPTLGNLHLNKVSVGDTPPEGMVNIAPAAERISAWPSVGRGIYSIADGDVSTRARFRGGVTKSGVYRLDFAAPVKVAGLRFRQGRLWALGYIAYADRDGDGTFGTVLDYAFDGAPGSWQGLSFPPRRLRSLKLRALGVKAGWERSGPTLHEIRVFATPESARGVEPPAAPEMPAYGPPQLRLGGATELPWPAPARRQEIQNCITVDLWMFGIPQSEDALPEEHLRDNERFQQTLDDIKDMGARGVLLFLEATRKAFWPSTNFDSFTNETYFEKLRERARPQPGAPAEEDETAGAEELLDEIGGEQDEKENGKGRRRTVPATVEELPNQRDLLQEFVDALHEEGLKVYVIARGEIFFPCYVGPGDQDAYMAFVEEVAARGVDGISVTSDEAYYGRNYPTGKTIPADHPARAQFRERWGEDAELPGSIWGRDVNYKRWTVSSYEKVGRRLRSYREAMQEIKPDCESFCVIGSHPISTNNRMTYGLAYDVIGHAADLDYFGTDYQNRETRRYAAADPDRRAAMELYVPRSVLPGIQSALLGARHISYYRYNYIEMQKSRGHRVREFKFMRALEDWGVTETGITDSIALVVSRAGEDWWDNNHGTCWLGHDPEAKRGFWTARAMTDFLNRNSYQYDLYYLDQPQDLDALKEYDVVFLPFPYSVKEEAVRKVEAAHASGARVLIAQKLGEVDEVGRRYDDPQFTDLVREGKADGTVRYLDRDFIEWEHDRDFDEKLGAVLDDLLGDRKPVEVKSYGSRVEAYVLDHEGQSRSVVLLNWADQSATADVALRLGEGQYRAYGLSSEEPESARSVGFGDGRRIPGDPARFRVDLAAGEALLVRFIP